MYRVEKARDEKYETYILKDLDAKTEAVISPQRGGMVVSFRLDGEEFIWVDKENYYEGEKPSCANPVLFPINSALKDNKFSYKGKEYEIPSHGFGRRRAWEVVGQSEDGEAKLSIALRDDEGTRKMYPFSFYVQLDYILKGQDLTMHFTFRNEGEEDMPYTYGIHPYFRIDSTETTNIRLSAKVYELLPNPELKPYDGKDFHLEIGESDGQRIFYDARESVGLEDPVSKRKVTVKFDKTFPVVVVWAKKDAGFVCLEPWNSAINALNEGGGRILEPNEVQEATLQMRFEKMN